MNCFHIFEKHLIQPAHVKTVYCHLLEYMPLLVYRPSTSPSQWHPVLSRKVFPVQVPLGCVKTFLTHQLGKPYVNTMEVSSTLSTTASLATGTQDLCISNNVQNSLQITCHLRSKICSKDFPETFKLLRTENALVHKPFVQNADSAVIFINPCPEICIKAGKFPLNLGSSRYEFRWKLFVPDRYVFWGIWGLRLGLSGLHRQTHVKATMCRSPTQTPSFARTDHAKGVLSKRKTGEDGYIEVRRIQQFRFFKGTNAELKLRSTLQ